MEWFFSCIAHQGINAIISNELFLGRWQGKAQFSFLVLVLLATLGSFARLHIESLVWVLIYAITFIWILGDLKRFLDAPLSVFLVVLFPLLALVSTFWSDAPSHTFRISIHLIMTVLVAIWIGLNFSPTKIFVALLVACGIGLSASLLMSIFPIISAYTAEDKFFIGIYTQKNVLGRLILLMSLSVLVVGIRFRWLWLAWPAALLLLLPLLQAQSATSLIFYTLSLFFPVLYFAVTTTQGIRQAIVLISLASVLMAIGAWASMDLSIMAPFLESLGKDSTLTGRTYLWGIALQMIALNPWAGIGFDAFWHAGDIRETQLIWDQFGMLKGFHNTLLEVLVALGVMGGMVFVITVMAFLVEKFNWLRKERSVESLGAVFLFVMTVLMSTVEIISFREFDTFYLLPCALFVVSRLRNFKKDSFTGL